MANLRVHQFFLAFAIFLLLLHVCHLLLTCVLNSVLVKLVLGCPLRIFKDLGLQREKVLIRPCLTIDLPPENLLRGFFRTHVGLIKHLIELFEFSFSHAIA